MTRRRRRKARPQEGGADVKGVVRTYKTIREDYVFDDSIFSEEPERIARTKWIIANKLNDVDRTLILLYADCLSFRKLGKRLGLSHTTVAGEIHRIKRHILEEYNKLKDTDL